MILFLFFNKKIKIKSVLLKNKNELTFLSYSKHRNMEMTCPFEFSNKIFACLWSWKPNVSTSSSSLSDPDILETSSENVNECLSRIIETKRWQNGFLLFLIIPVTTLIVQIQIFFYYNTVLQSALYVHCSVHI